MGVRVLKGWAALLVLGLCLTTGGAFAVAITGSNVTIADDNTQSGSNGGFTWGVGEDQEVEPGCVGAQAWDLEGFFLNGNVLSMVGGWNFQSGLQDPYRSGNTYYYTSGDIFIDVNNNAQYGNDGASDGHANPTQYGGMQNVSDDFGYDYVIHFTDLDSLGRMNSGAYSVYSLLGAELTTTATFDINYESNPWRLFSGGTLVPNVSGTATFSDLGTSNVTYDGGSFVGGQHRQMGGIDLTWLADLGYGLNPSAPVLLHFTMECGNDSLMGQVSSLTKSPPVPVPEPSTILLMGLAVGGLVVRRLKTQLI